MNTSNLYSSALYENQYSLVTAHFPVITDTESRLLGHGQTRTKSENFTYWDTAIMNLQVLEALGIQKAFVLGTSQGGWITVRMALLRPDMIEGIIPLGTSLDNESERTRKLGCWNGPADLAPSIKAWTSNKPVSDFEPGTDFSNFLIDIGFGKDCDKSTRQFWNDLIRENYRGEEGRKRIRMASINLADRDGLHQRLSDVKCPVLWLHGTADPVYSVANAEEEIKLFTNSKDAQLKVVKDGQHFLSFSHPKVRELYFNECSPRPKRSTNLYSANPR